MSEDQTPPGVDLPPDEQPQFACPFCRGPIEIPSIMPPGFLLCPHCGQQFVLSGNDETESSDDAEGSSSDDELDARRITQLSTARRATYRSRSYCIIALGGCLVGASELVYDAVVRLRAHLGFVRPAFYVLAAIGLLLLGGYFLKLALRFHREAKLSIAAHPHAAPDFSKLSDGSQRERNLEQL
jgi:hypothetical protein